MNHLRYWSLTAFTLVLLLVSARACGPDFPSAVFVLPENPDSIPAFIDGHLALLEPGFHTRHLVVAYRYLSGQPLSAAERKDATAANVYLARPSDSETGSPTDAPKTPVQLWLAARTQAGAPDDETLENQVFGGRNVPGEDYSGFNNCLDPAFTAATATLTARIQQHGAKDPAVRDWLNAQDAVFSNCGNGEAPSYGNAPAPPKHHPPAAAPVDAPLWLQQDRAYQLAAAHFYNLEFDAALAGFRAIAADNNSPWSITARYLIARTLIRKATLSADLSTADKNADAQRADAQQHDTAALTLARNELLTMRDEPRMKPLLPDIDGLLDYVAIRIDPSAQSLALARRFLTPDHPRLRQSLIDFTVLHTTGDEGNSITAITAAPGKANTGPDSTSTPPNTPADLIAWVELLNASTPPTLGNDRAQASDGAAIAFKHWQSSHTTVWLAAALMLTAKPDADTPALLAAARAVSATDPAYLTVTYHRLRLGPQDAASRAEVLSLLKRKDGPSTTNQLTALAALTSPTLDDWLLRAPRTPAGESSWDGGIDPPTLPKEDVCGRKPTGYQLFDTDAAVALNQQMPLRLLAAAAESTALPENLRFQVAQAAWARAVLLDQPAIARRMTPVLESCRATWKPVLDAYDNASTPTDRHAAGLLALLRFASTEPSVRDGEERRSGFATYDEFRQNWWCSTVPLPSETVDAEPASFHPGRDPDAPYGSDPAGLTTHPHTAPPPPAFLTAADLAEATAQAAQLRAIPNASTYFAQQALTWYQQHPSDPRTPEILGQADRALRNACRRDPPYDPKDAANSPGPYTKDLAKQLFDTLHQHFPNSAWAKRYATWQ